VAGEESYSVEMAVVNSEPNGTFQTTARLIRAEEDGFLDQSQILADHLNEAQDTARIPDSVLLVGSGTVGESNKNIVVLIKAETHDGFSLAESENQIDVEFVQNLFLTPGQKLYKVAVIREDQNPDDDEERRDPGDFSIAVYDHNLRRGANIAQYFYQQFLDCELAESAKQLTKQFFRRSQEAFDQLSIDDDERLDLNSHLYTYVKSNRRLLRPGEFAEEFIEEEDHQDNYLRYLRQHDVRNENIPKDLALIQSSLRRRRLSFTTGISVAGKSDSFGDLVEIVGQEDHSTLIRIQGQIDSNR